VVLVASSPGVGKGKKDLIAMKAKVVSFFIIVNLSQLTGIQSANQIS